MLNLFKRQHQRREKSTLSLPPKYRRGYSPFYFKEWAWDNLCRQHQWSQGKGAIRLFSEALHCTKALASMIVNRRIGCSAPMIALIAELMGIRENECCCHLFDRYKVNKVPSNHPLYNMAKFRGEMPYERYSVRAELRKKDYSVEKRLDKRKEIL